MQDPAVLTVSEELESVLHRYRVKVRQAAYGHGLTDVDLDELVQEVRIRLWKARERGENLLRLPASYLYRAAVSAAVDLIRRRRTAREQRTVSLTDAPEVQVASRVLDATSRTLEETEFAEQLGRALDAIPAARASVVRMYLLGYDRLEIARLMRWTEAKTRNLLYRGLGDLRAELTRMGLDPGAAE